MWMALEPGFAGALVHWVAEHTETVLLAFLSLFPPIALHPAVNGWGALGLGLVVYGRLRLSTAVLVLALVFGLREQPTGTRIEILDVGQGNAALIYVPGEDPILLDGGSPGSGLVPYLRRRRISRLSAVVASHGDSDHAGALSEVLDTMGVGELWLGGLGKASHLQEQARHLGIPVFGCAGLRERDLPVNLWCDLHPSTENDASLVVGAGDVLFMGDLSSMGEATFLTTAPRSPRVLVLAHHGSRSSSSWETLSALSPRLAVISASRNNRYGHPHLETLDRLAQLDIPHHVTATGGAIVFEGTAPMRARTFRSVEGWSEWLSLDAWPLAVHQTETRQGQR